MFSRYQILIVTWKEQVQHSAIEKSVFQTVFVTQFLVYCTFENKSNKTCEYEPEELDENPIENNHFRRNNAMLLSKMNPSIPRDK